MNRLWQTRVFRSRFSKSTVPKREMIEIVFLFSNGALSRAPTAASDLRRRPA